jgi:hypothetical protein
MNETLRRSTEWREKSTEYTVMAKDRGNSDLQKQYAELADRYLEIAEKLESQAGNAPVLRALPSGR